MSGMGAFMEGGVDLPDARIVDPAGRGGVRDLQETNAHIDGFRVFQKTSRPCEPNILEVRKCLLDARIEERLIEACRLFEIGHNDIDVSQRIN
jgi:hypothetical protein